MSVCKYQWRFLLQVFILNKGTPHFISDCSDKYSWHLSTITGWTTKHYLSFCSKDLAPEAIQEPLGIWLTLGFFFCVYIYIVKNSLNWLFQCGYSLHTCRPLKFLHCMHDKSISQTHWQFFIPAYWRKVQSWLFQQLLLISALPYCPWWHQFLAAKHKFSYRLCLINQTFPNQNFYNNLTA